ncbi:MAG: EscC/YscC/HrcC family type secretion system outer rane ring protein [Fibrobacteres bacterium]|nr:EscC/YscC/HrcC family type secretion system outer rane ring protein [Fibrobacterota bacterium]
MTPKNPKPAAFRATLAFSAGIAIAITLMHGEARAGEPKWRKEPYTHMAQDEALRDMLADFGADNGIRTVISRKITDKVSGRFDGMEPRRFIEKISKAYGLTWYYDGSSLFFYKADDVRTRVMSLQFITFTKLAGTLKEMGIWDERFPLRTARADDAVYVSGPPRYVELVIETANRLDGKEMENAPTFADGQMVKVFPLRYAWAADVTFSQEAGKQMTVPGIASLLNGIINKDPLPIRPPWMAAEASAALRGLSPKSEDRPDQLLPMVLNQGLTKGRTGILADSRTNSVIIKDTKENLQRYLSLVNSLDVPAGLVELSATIIDISDASVRDIGVEWQQTNTTHSGGSDFNNLHGQTFSDLSGGPKPGQTGTPVPAPPALLDGYTFSTLVGKAGSVLMARVRLLEKIGKAKIASRPAVLTFDNLRANIAHTETFHVRVSGERDANLFRIESGTVLRVTPHIVEDEGEKSIRLVVEIEDGSPSRETSVDAIPTVNTSVINTQAVVGDGESLLLGGFVRTEESNTSYQVPWLGSIPVIGFLFRKNTRVKARIERVFMITPRIIQTPGEAGLMFESDDKERQFQKYRIPDQD